MNTNQIHTTVTAIIMATCSLTACSKVKSQSASPSESERVRQLEAKVAELEKSTAASSSGGLTNQNATRTLKKFFGPLAFTLIGIQEFPQQNTATARLALDRFQYLPSQQFTQTTRTYSGPAIAEFTHYSDGRWVLTSIQFDNDTGTTWSPNFTVDLSGAVPDTETVQKRLIGKWQGERHVVEYLSDHSRLIDGVSTNPPRRWELNDDNRLIEIDNHAPPAKAEIRFYRIFINGDELTMNSTDGGPSYHMKRIK